MQPNQKISQLLWRSIISISPAMANFTNWTITGMAAFAGLVVANLTSISTFVDPLRLRLFLYFSVASIFFGATSRPVGVALEAGMAMIRNLEVALQSEDGQALIKSKSVDSESLADQISEPFWWPISYFMKRSFYKGADDPLTRDKRYVWLWCLQWFSNLIHLIFVIGAGLCLALNFH